MARTYSRYDFMESSKTPDEVTGAIYPDPLTLNYNNFELKETVKSDEMTDDKISSFWHEAEKVYGSAIYDDVVLTLNGVPHKNLLKAGEEIYFPTANDIENSVFQE